ncbi:MAG: CerR family C-terminal domain-containing protein [Candidatus Binatia bacterium]
MRRVPTRRRLLRAASELFAERGFHGTTVRDIAARAGVNLASGNYHFGSKKELYLEVLRTQFAEIRAELERRGARVAEAELGRMSRPELERLLQARIGAMLELLIGPPPGLHGALMQREMTDPSEALPMIAAEFIRPMKREMQQILSHLVPELDGRDLEHCIFSIVGQVLHYRAAMPLLLELLGRSQYPRSFAAELADHITEFSLGGMARLVARRPRRERGQRHAG